MTLLVTIINFYIKLDFLIHFLQLFWFLASNFGTFSQPYSCQFQKHIFLFFGSEHLCSLSTNYLHRHAVLKYQKNSQLVEFEGYLVDYGLGVQFIYHFGSKNFVRGFHVKIRKMWKKFFFKCECSGHIFWSILTCLSNLECSTSLISSKWYIFLKNWHKMVLWVKMWVHVFMTQTLYRYITNTLLFLYSDTLVLSCETLASGHLCVCISRCVDVSHTNPLVRGYGCLFVTITML